MEMVSVKRHNYMNTVKGVFDETFKFPIFINYLF